MRTRRFKLAAGIAGAAAMCGVLAVGCTPTAITEPLGQDVGVPPAGAAPPWGAPPTTTARPLPTPPPSPPAPTPSTPAPTTRPPAATGGPLHPAHVVVVVEENHSPAAIAGGAPYLASLAAGGADFTDAHAERHPSEPNYLALFSGSTHGVASDTCPLDYHGPNLAAQLIAAGLSFTGYAEGMPSPGFTGCTAGSTYARKHVPWADYGTVPAADSLPWTRFPQGDYAALPRVSFVVPDLCHDMHDCSVATGDAWLRTNLGGYARWALTHDSLLVVVFDEAEDGVPNRIPLVIYGQHMKPGRYTRFANHYTILRTLEMLFGLGCIGEACGAKPITDAWR